MLRTAISLQTAIVLTCVCLTHAGPVPPLPSGSLSEGTRTNSARSVTAAYRDVVAPAGKKGLTWTGDLAKGLARASKEKKLVFLEFTAATNVNAAYNHRVVFAKEPVQSALSPYVLVTLYVDVIPEEFFSPETSEKLRFAEAEANYQFEKDAFATEAVPWYVFVKPLGDGKFEIVGRTQGGRVNDEEKFVDFLSAPSSSDK